MFLGLPLGASRSAHWLEPVFAEADGDPRPRSEAGYALFGIDGVLILASVARRGDRHRHRLAAVRRRDRRRSALPAAPGARPRAHAPGCRSCTAPRSTSGGSTTSTTCCSWSSAAASPAALWWFDREVVDGTVNAVGAATVDAGRGLRQVQTGRVQNYALGIAIGLIVMAGSYLVLAGG